MERVGPTVLWPISKRRLTRSVALLGAPTALLFAAVLHPRAYGSAETQLEVASAHSERWIAADLAALVALVLAPFFVIALARAAGGAGSRLVRVGWALALAGVPLAAGRVTLDMVVWSLADRRLDPAVPSLVRDVQEGWLFVAAFAALPLLLLAGVAALALALARARPRLRITAIVLAAGVLLIALGPLVRASISNLLEAVGAALLLVGAGQVYRMPDPASRDDSVPPASEDSARRPADRGLAWHG